VGMFGMCPACGSDWCTGCECVKEQAKRDVAKARREGRMEVYREIAAVDPMAYAPGGTECQFCEQGRDHHDADCLWLRAKNAIATGETK
jgi:hypothetical protein